MRNAIVLAIAAGVLFGQEPAAQQVKPVQIVALQSQIAALQADLVIAQGRLENLRATYTDSHPEVVSARAKVEQLQAQLGLVQRQLAWYKVLASAGIIQGSPARGAVSSDSPKIPLPDRWWRNAATAQYLGLTADQQKKMDDVVAQYRAKLTENNYELERQEKLIARMVSTEPLDEGATTAQIDRVAEARAELEKTNGRMLLGIRKLLKPEQWTKMNQAFTMSLTQRDPAR